MIILVSREREITASFVYTITGTLWRTPQAYGSTNGNTGSETYVSGYTLCFVHVVCLVINEQAAAALPLGELLSLLFSIKTSIWDYTKVSPHLGCR